MSRFRMLTDPAVFVARGLSPEMARAEALQADRATVLQRMPDFEPSRWFIHRELPEDPYKPASSLDGDPWNEPHMLGCVEPVFTEGLFSRAMHVLVTLHELKRASRRFRDIHLEG